MPPPVFNLFFCKFHLKPLIQSIHTDKKPYDNKSTFTATNAMINLNIIGAMSSGDGYRTASTGNLIEMPKIFTVKKGTESIQLPDYDKSSSKIHVAEEANNGAMGKVYTADTSATAKNYSVSDSGLLTLPTDATADQFVVLYKRKVASGVEITNRADKFPSTVSLYIKALAYEPCTADTLRAVVIYLPSFQVSPEVKKLVA